MRSNFQTKVKKCVPIIQTGFKHHEKSFVVQTPGSYVFSDLIWNTHIESMFSVLVNLSVSLRVATFILNGNKKTAYKMCDNSKLVYWSMVALSTLPYNNVFCSEQDSAFYSIQLPPSFQRKWTQIWRKHEVANTQGKTGAFGIFSQHSLVIVTIQTEIG